MKYTLKNRPNIDKMDESEWCYEIGEWFVGFEKELRERKPKDEDIVIRSMHDNVKTKIALNERRNLIKEILGETQP
jgi:hypothetical protein